MKHFPKCEAENRNIIELCNECREKLNLIPFSSAGIGRIGWIIGIGTVVLVIAIIFGFFPGLFSIFTGEGTSAMVLIPESNGVKAFYIDKYLVTFDQYDKFCEATDRGKPNDIWGRGTRPVIDVSWNDAQAYAEWVGKRLPTEAEYEVAIRGGTTTDYFWGNDAAQAGDYAWYKDDSGSMTHPVGEKKPNAYGLYDIVGNLWEWCDDWYDSTQTMRSMRGGSFSDSIDNLESASRGRNVPIHRSDDLGFRCAKTP